VDTRGYLPDSTQQRYRGYFKAEKEDIFPAYRWERFGFAIEEDKADRDRYIMDANSGSSLTKTLWKLIDANGDRKLSDMELTRALHNLYVMDKLSRMVCYHRSEWSYGDPAAWSGLEKELGSFLDSLKDKNTDWAVFEERKKQEIAAFKEQVKKLGFWSDIKIDTSAEEGEEPLAAFPSSPYVYHFHPLGFVGHMKKIKKCFCNKEHIDLRAPDKYISQFSDVFGTSEDQKTACYDASQYILYTHYGLHKETSRNDGTQLQVAKEIKGSNSNSQDVYLEIDSKIAKEGIQYIDEQLEAGYPVLVGVDHTFDKKLYNPKTKEHRDVNKDKTTDHWIVIAGRGCMDDKSYYYFYEVGTMYDNLGRSDNNKLYLGVDNVLRGAPAHNTAKSYVVTQIRKNKLP
jgi:hypothetical protein